MGGSRTISTIAIRGDGRRLHWCQHDPPHPANHGQAGRIGQSEKAHQTATAREFTQGECGEEEEARTYLTGGGLAANLPNPPPHNNSMEGCTSWIRSV